MCRRTRGDLLVRFADMMLRRAEGFQNRTRSAACGMQEIQQEAATAPRGQQTDSDIAQTLSPVPKGCSSAPAVAIAALPEKIAHYRGLGDRVIDQSPRRVPEVERTKCSKGVCVVIPCAGHNITAFGRSVLLRMSRQSNRLKYSIFALSIETLHSLQMWQ
jgi:hypothetical protein